MVDKEKLDQLLSNTGDMALKRRAKRLIEELGPKPGGRILDAGCGDGFYLHLLSNLGEFELVGLDSDPRALESARKNLKGRKVKLVEGDVLKTPFKDNYFDKIICSEVLEHLSDDLAGLKELKRVLKPGGTLMITVPNHNYPFLWDPVNWVLERVFKTHIKSGFWAGIWNQHLRLYYPGELRRSVEDAGFKVEKFECLTHYCLPFNHYLLNLGARILATERLPRAVTCSVSKYSERHQEPFFQRVLEILNKLDALNNRTLRQKSAVGILVKAGKQ